MTPLFPPRESLVVTSRLGTGNSRSFFLRRGVHHNRCSINSLYVVQSCSYTRNQLFFYLEYPLKRCKVVYLQSKLWQHAHRENRPEPASIKKDNFFTWNRLEGCGGAHRYSAAGWAPRWRSPAPDAPASSPPASPTSGS